MSGTDPVPADVVQFVHVVAGALFNTNGEVLIAQRPGGKHMAGRWEFPGGKRDHGEARFDALRRELKEELGVDVEAAEPLICYEHSYSDRVVLLDLWRVAQYAGQPESREGQALAWVRVQDLGEIDLLEADWTMVEALRALPGPEVP
jgi:8-oxo-dGTP diphosphatase